ncbi:MAG TPA: CapA family protein [Candidatus Paceibacterota bacterium]|nr:CapA family protein [Candidatus Paceibacterota bacterium]
MRRPLIFLGLLFLATGFMYQITGPWQFSTIKAAVLESVVAKTVPKTETLTIAWVGDMVPPESEAYAAGALTTVATPLTDADITLGNLEGTFATSSTGSKCGTGSSNCHAFRGTPTFASILKTTGFDAVSLANNHSLDFGEKGLGETETVLAKAALPFVSSRQPVTYIAKNGFTIGLVGISSTPPQETITDYDFIQKKVSEAKAKSDLVLVLFHGGAEGSDKLLVPNGYEYLGNENRGFVRRAAQVAIDAGADGVLGSGPHVLRGIELYHGKPIAYSLGNFVGSEKLITKGVLATSGILKITFAKDGTFIDGEVVPVTLDKAGVPHLDVAQAALALVAKLSQQNFGETGALFTGNLFK